MPKCSYCGANYEFPRGLTLVDTIGKVKYLCSSKCHKYFLMNRSKGKWASSREKADLAQRKADRIERADQAEKAEQAKKAKK